MSATKKTRARIPKPTARLILVEAGLRCSVPRCTHETGLEIHHIDEDPSNNALENLLLICAIHHAQATKGDLDRKACREIKARLAQTAPAVDHERLAKLVAEQLLETEDWPDPLDTAALSLEQIATQVEAEIDGRVEVLAKQADLLFVWVTVPIPITKANFRELKAVLLAVACLLGRVDGVRTIEIGFCDTAALVRTTGMDGLGSWRVAFDVADVLSVADNKRVEESTWKKARVLITAGDNLRVGQQQASFDDFEASALLLESLARPRGSPRMTPSGNCACSRMASIRPPS